MLAENCRLKYIFKVEIHVVPLCGIFQHLYFFKNILNENILNIITPN